MMVERKRTPATTAHGAAGDVTAELDRLFQEGVLIDLHIGFWTARARNEKPDLKIEADETLPEMIVGLGTKALIPKEMSATWVEIANRARYVIHRHSFEFPVGNSRFVPAKALPMVEQELTELQQQFEKAAGHLMSKFDTIKEEWIARQPREHRARLARLYPQQSEIRSLFYFTWSVYTVSLPKKIKMAVTSRQKVTAQEKAVAEAQHRYQHELHVRCQQFITEAVNTLRAKTMELCDDVRAKIRAGDVVTDRTLNTLARFVDRFATMNFAGDTEVERHLQTLKQEVLTNRTSDDFKDDEALRRQLDSVLSDTIKEAQAITDATATRLYRRRIITD